MAKINSGEYTAITIAEDVTVEMDQLLVYTYDAVSASDSFLTVGKSLLEVTSYDNVSIVENAIYHHVILIINVNDSIGIEEHQLVVNVGMVSDSISVATSVTLFIPVLILSAYTSVSITDTFTTVVAQLKVYDSVYIRTIFNESIEDTTYESVANTIVSTQTIFASAVRTATVGLYISESFKVSSAIMLRFHFNVTAEVGTSSLGSIIQTSPDNVTWYDALTIDAITATGQYSGTLTLPGVYVRVKSIVTGTSMAYSCLMTKHMINRQTRVYV